MGRPANDVAARVCANKGFSSQRRTIVPARVSAGDLSRLFTGREEKYLSRNGLGSQTAIGDETSRAVGSGDFRIRRVVFVLFLNFEINGGRFSLFRQAR